MSWWEYASFGIGVLLFAAAFGLVHWGREARSPERRNPWNHIHPGSGGA